MGMIRVSDHAEKIIKKQANGRTISATVDALIAGGGESSAVLGKLDYLESYIDKRLSKLESLLEDTAVDRVDGPRKSTSYSNTKVYVPWETAHELLYEFLPEDAPEFIGNASEQIRQADYEFPVFIMDGKLWTEDAYGTKSPILNVTQRINEMLAEIMEGNANVA